MRIHFISILFLIGLVVRGEVPAAAGVPSRPDWFSRVCTTGRAAHTAGDVNGDGYDDAIVGSGSAACVYHGSIQGLNAIPEWIAESEDTFSEFGASAGTAGDVNGDGYDDVIVGARSYGEDDEGRVYVYYGSAMGLSKEPDWIQDGEGNYDYFGSSVGTAGDLNGDGYDEVIIGTFVAFGWAYVYRGSSNGLGANPAWSVGPSQLHTNVIDVATAGDVNDDGYDDVILGAHEYEGFGADEAFVYHGSAHGLSQVPDWVSDGPHSNGFGWSVGRAGDVNGDGYDEVIIGSFYFNDNPLERAYLYQGSAAGLGANPAWTLVSDQGYSGNAVGTAGDINADGFDDIIVGAAYSDNPQPDIGEAYGFYGSASGPSPSPDWIVRGNQSKADLGLSVGTAGDTNGDGYDDVILGARLYTGVYYHLGAQP